METKVTLEALEKLGLTIKKSISNIYEEIYYKKTNLELTEENFESQLSTLESKLDYNDCQEVWELIEIATGETKYSTVEQDWFFACLKETIEKSKFTEPTFWGIFDEKDQAFLEEWSYQYVDKDELIQDFIKEYKNRLLEDVAHSTLEENTKVNLENLDFDLILRKYGFRIKKYQDFVNKEKQNETKQKRD